MDDRNPYAPSRASLQQGAATPRPLGGNVTAWRDNKVMVILPDTPIPHRCVKCNEPADEPTKARKVYWHTPWLYLLLLFNVLIFAIIAMVVRKKAIVSLGLCADHKRRRRNVIATAWIGLLAGIILIYVGASSSAGVWGAGVGSLVALGSIVFGMVAGRIVIPIRIDKEYVRLKGCGRAYLETLPPFPGG
jgi:hypothetical protein